MSEQMTSIIPVGGGFKAFLISIVSQMGGIVCMIGIFVHNLVGVCLVDGRCVLLCMSVLVVLGPPSLPFSAHGCQVEACPNDGGT